VLWLLLACSGTPPTPAPDLTSASGEVTFGTLASLGSCVLEASLQQVDRFGDEPAAPRTTTWRLRWQGVDHWSAERTAEGGAVERMTVYDGVPWTSRGSEQWRAEVDAEPLRVQLAHTWDPWVVATELFSERLAYTETGTEEFEGRRVRTFTLGLTPPAAGRRRVWEPTALSGRVWLDEASAVRVLADLSGELRSGNQVRTVELKLSLHGIGLDAGVSRPAGVDGN